ncbi:Ultraviolet N-glycosylase/AP lyase [Patescibacteria group bacterium]|nr:endonuclease III [Candidatus Dojkabacteria bacterium]CAG1023152.1 Ultraviolet N-glycosylase/AP lyase [Patescibacteria group bacterium]
MTLKDKAKLVYTLLKRDFPVVETPLHHKDAFTLLVAVVLSAQTTDNAVNKVTPLLWERYHTMEALSTASPEAVAEILRGINYKYTKAKNIIKLSQQIINEFNGQVPYLMSQLVSLPGVGRKTANVVINQWFAKKEKVTLPVGFVVDTHVKRVAFRLGLTKNTDPDKVEKDLMKLFPQEEWDDVGLRIIYHGRTMCTARNPKCYLDPEWSKICSCVKLARKG